jgi:hypothetical protein
MNKTKQRNARKAMTGNMPADMIFACLAHHKAMRLKIKEIRLRPNWWETFLEFLKDKSPEMNIHNSCDQVEFKNVTIKKGHSFMKENMEFDIQKPVATA